MSRIGPRFARRESFQHACDLVTGLMADIARKNCWTLAEHVGDDAPYGLQNLLSRASWDTDGVAEDLRDYVSSALGDAGAMLVVDETGDVKKGQHTVGVQRQYTGTAGRVENAQVAVCMTYAADDGHALIDRELYLPKSAHRTGYEHASKSRSTAEGSANHWSHGSVVFRCDSRKPQSSTTARRADSPTPAES